MLGLVMRRKGRAARGPMTERSVELHRRVYQAFNARDVDALLGLCDRSIVVESAFGAVSGAIYHGHDGVRSWQADLEEAWAMKFASRSRPISTSASGCSPSTFCTGVGEKSSAEVAMP